MHVYRLLAMLLLTGCASTIDTQVVGPYAARLAAADIEQITRLAYGRVSSDRRFIKLEAIKPNKVRVETTSYQHSGWGRTRFTAVRRDGNWVLDEKSEATAEDETTIITN
jgi:hypothetical protein